MCAHVNSYVYRFFNKIKILTKFSFQLLQNYCKVNMKEGVFFGFVCFNLFVTIILSQDYLGAKNKT